MNTAIYFTSLLYFLRHAQQLELPSSFQANAVFPCALWHDRNGVRLVLRASDVAFLVPQWLIIKLKLYRDFGIHF